MRFVRMLTRFRGIVEPTNIFNLSRSLLPLPNNDIIEKVYAGVASNAFRPDHMCHGQPDAFMEIVQNKVCPHSHTL